jgi:hypothetical protein
VNFDSESKKTGVLWSVNESSDDKLAVKKNKEEEWRRVGEGGGQCKVRDLPICAMKAFVVLSCSSAHA